MKRKKKQASINDHPRGAVEGALKVLVLFLILQASRRQPGVWLIFIERLTRRLHVSRRRLRLV